MFGIGGGDDKYQDRAWDWGKDWSNSVKDPWYSIFNQSKDSALSGNLTPRGQSIYGQAQQYMAPFLQPFQESDQWKTLSGLWDNFSEDEDPWTSELMAGARKMYKPNVKPLYGDLMEPLKRGIEGQYGNTVDQMLSSGVRGGALSDALADAAMSRTTQLGDTERNLRVQDKTRLDQARRERAAALTDLASRMYQTNQTGQIARAGALSQLGSQQDRQSLLASQSLINLLSGLSQGDMDRALQMAQSGMNARLGVATNLAGGEQGGNAGMAQGLMGMGSMLGMGLGSSGAFDGFGGWLSGLFGGGGPEQLGQF